MKSALWFTCGFYSCLLLVLISLKIAKYQLNHRECMQCKKKYWTKNSTCKDFPALFCSEWCNKSQTMDMLIKKGLPPALAIRAATQDWNEDATKKGGNA